MAKLASDSKPNPGPALPCGRILPHPRPQAPRQALAIIWPPIPDAPRSVRLRIQPRPRPNRSPVPPVVFCNFEISE